MRYFRLHGRAGYRHKYSDDELEELRGGIGIESPCYIMFNNVAMFEDARRFAEIVRTSSPGGKV
jgi:uncharacterized protein YecE (DUF72 family)